jgi:hypothetical protein
MRGSITEGEGGGVSNQDDPTIARNETLGGREGCKVEMDSFVEGEVGQIEGGGGGIGEFDKLEIVLVGMSCEDLGG